MGAGAGLVLAFVSLFASGTVRYSLLAMALVLPALMFQDHWRSTFIAFGEPRRAFAIDLTWGVLWALAFLVLIQGGAREAAVFILVWGAGALVAGLYGSRLAGTWAAFRGVLAWFATHRQVSVPSLANTFATLGSAQVAFLLVSVLGSVTDLGSLRGTQTLLGPLNIVGFAVLSFAVPELIRRAPSARGLILAGVGIGGALMLVAATWGGFLLLLPDSAGRELLGETWPGARHALLGMVLYQCAVNATVGTTVVLRCLNRVHTVLWLSTLSVPLVLTGAVLGVLVNGDAGAAFGFALAGGLLLVPTGYVLVRDARLGRRQSAHLATG